MLDPVSAIAGATAAYNGIKKAVEVGKEISSFTGAISQFAKASSDIDFLEQDFLGDVLKQLNEQLAKQMRSEFDKKRSGEGVITGKDEATGIIILSEEPQWLVIRETESNYFELRLDQEYGYNINIVQGDEEIYDYEIGGNVNEINIIQSN